MNDNTPEPLQNDPLYGTPLSAADPKTDLGLPAGRHIDMPGTTHVDVPAGPHADVGPRHTDQAIHVDAQDPAGHVDTSLTHIDNNVVPHVDQTLLPHTDVIAPPHIDVTIPDKTKSEVT